MDDDEPCGKDEWWFRKYFFFVERRLWVYRGKWKMFNGQYLNRNSSSSHHQPYKSPISLIYRKIILASPHVITIRYHELPKSQNIDVLSVAVCWGQFEALKNVLASLQKYEKSFLTKSISPSLQHFESEILKLPSVWNVLNLHFNFSKWSWLVIIFILLKT